LSVTSFAIRVGDRFTEHQPIESRRRERCPAADRPGVDARPADVMHVSQRRVGAHDEIDLLVVERRDDPKRTNHIGSVGVPRVRLIEERLVDVRLNHRELDTRLVPQAPNIFGRSSRRQHFKIDVGRRRDEARQIATDLDVRTSFRSRDDLVVGGRLGNADLHREDDGANADEHAMNRSRVHPNFSPRHVT
jgi:hypothetical protein